MMSSSNITSKKRIVLYSILVLWIVKFCNSLENRFYDDKTTSTTELLQQSINLARQEYVQKMCDSLSSNVKGYDSDVQSSIEDLNAEDLDHILVDREHKLLYCYVPKVACTNWKRVLLYLSPGNNATDVLSIPANLVHSSGMFDHLGMIADRAERARILSEYTRFVMVRHPFERLLSAYRNKLQGNGSSALYFQSRIGRYIVKRFRQNPSKESLLRGHDVTFKEFCEYIISLHRQQSKNNPNDDGSMTNDITKSNCTKSNNNERKTLRKRETVTVTKPMTRSHDDVSNRDSHHPHHHRDEFLSSKRIETGDRNFSINNVMRSDKLNSDVTKSKKDLSKNTIRNSYSERDRVSRNSKNVIIEEDDAYVNLNKVFVNHVKASQSRSKRDITFDKNSNSIANKINSTKQMDSQNFTKMIDYNKSKNISKKYQDSLQLRTKQSVINDNETNNNVSNVTSVNANSATFKKPLNITLKHTGSDSTVPVAKINSNTTKTLSNTNHLSLKKNSTFIRSASINNNNNRTLKYSDSSLLRNKPDAMTTGNRSTSKMNIDMKIKTDVRVMNAMKATSSTVRSVSSSNDPNNAKSSSNSAEVFNEHWTPAHKLCHPCAVKYNVIGKYETLNEDSRLLLSIIDPTHRVRFPSMSSTHRSQSTGSRLRQALDTLPVGLLERLYRVYETDFKVFGYGLENLLGFEFE